jgi:DNA-binding protein HU-beta
MNKAELIGAVAKKAGLSKVDAKKAIDAFVSETKAALKKKKNVTLVGFGTFSVNKRAARTGRNPQTGKAIKIAAKNVAKFKPGKELKDAIK